MHGLCPNAVDVVCQNAPVETPTSEQLRVGRPDPVAYCAVVVMLSPSSAKEAMR